MSDKPRLAEARRVAEAATEGPWRAITTGTGGGDHWFILDRAETVAYLHANDGADEDQRRPDAEFIAASRTLVPALLAAVDAVLAVHVPCNVGGKQLCEYCTATGDPFCTPDGTDEWPCPTVRAIAAHLDIEPR